MSGLSIVIQRPKGACKGKVRYGGVSSANKACHVMSKKGVTGLTPYACDGCAGWHIGHDIDMDAILKEVKQSFRDQGIELIDD